MKGALVGIWEAPSAGSLRQASDASKALEDAMKAAEATFAKVGSVNDALRTSGLAITLP